MTVFEGSAGCSPCPAGIWSAETHRSRPAAKIERLEAGNMCVCVCVSTTVDHNCCRPIVVDVQV